MSPWVEFFRRETLSVEVRESWGEVFDAMEYAFDNLREEDTLLTFLSLYASNKLDELRLSAQLFEALLLGSDGKFAKHFIPKISGSSRDPFSIKHEDLAGLQWDFSQVPGVWTFFQNEALYLIQSDYGGECNFDLCF